MIEIKTDVDGFVKTSTGALLNKDNDALIAYKAQKKRNALISTLEKKYQELEQKVLYLENELYKINKRFDNK